MKIEACEPPHHLAVSSVDEYGKWHLEAHLTEQDGITEMRFVQHRIDTAMVGEVGPGWEYYLDRFAAALRDEPHARLRRLLPVDEGLLRSRWRKDGDVLSRGTRARAAEAADGGE